MARATRIVSGVDLARDRFPIDMKEARYFLSKTYNKITVEIKLIKAKKKYIMTLVAYNLSFTRVLILHNYQLFSTYLTPLTWNCFWRCQEIISQASFRESNRSDCVSDYLVKEVPVDK